MVFVPFMRQAEMRKAADCLLNRSAPLRLWASWCWQGHRSAVISS
jgi:hypothetical protein